MADNEVKAKVYDADGKVVEEEKLPFCTRIKNDLSAFINGKPKEEWGLLIFCFLVFYLFMTCWMAIHMYVMVYNLPDRVEWAHNTVQLGETRHSRFHVDGIVVANAHNGNYTSDQDIRSPSWEPVSEPWNAGMSDKSPLESRDVDCGSGASCEAFQQLRVLNKYTLRILETLPINVACWPYAIYFDNVEQASSETSTVSFSGVTDPIAAKRNTSISAKTFNESVMTAPAWEIELAQQKTGDFATKALGITWPVGHAAPHIVQYKVGVTKPAAASVVTLKVKCKVSFEDPDFKDVYHFDDNNKKDDTELTTIDGIDELDYTYKYHFD